MFKAKAVNTGRVREEQMLVSVVAALLVFCRTSRSAEAGPGCLGQIILELLPLESDGLSVWVQSHAGRQLSCSQRGNNENAL